MKQEFQAKDVCAGMSHEQYEKVFDMLWIAIEGKSKEHSGLFSTISKALNKIESDIVVVKEHAIRTDLNFEKLNGKVAAQEKTNYENSERIKSLDADNEKTVTKDEFWPVKTIVYGGVGVVLLAVAGALIALVVNK